MNEYRIKHEDWHTGWCDTTGQACALAIAFLRWHDHTLPRTGRPDLILDDKSLGLTLQVRYLGGRVDTIPWKAIVVRIPPDWQPGD